MARAVDPGEPLGSEWFDPSAPADDDLRHGLGALLSELRDEPCGHSWRLPLGALPPADQGLDAAREAWAAVTAWEYARRDSKFALYRLDGAVVGVATVAPRVRRTFAHDGFPVLARAFLRPGMRGRGFYPAMVRHRLEACVRELGADLRGVHLGVSDPLHLAGLPTGPGGRTFVPIGTEWLPLPGGGARIHDALLFAPAFAAKLVEEASDSGAWSMFVERGGDDAVRQALRCSSPLGAAADLFFAFCDAVPLSP